MFNLQSITKTQFHVTGHWEHRGTWTSRNGSCCDHKAWSFSKQQVEEHNRHGGCGSHHRTWKCGKGLLCPPWFDLRTESLLSQTAEVHLWGIQKTLLETGRFKADKVQSLKSKRICVEWHCDTLLCYIMLSFYRAWEFRIQKFYDCKLALIFKMSVTFLLWFKV